MVSRHNQAGAAHVQPTYGRIVRRAVLQPTNLGVACTAIVAAVAFGSWAIVVLGLAAYAALVAWDLVNPDFWRKVLSSTPTAELPRLPFPAPESFANPALANLAREVQAARVELDRVRAEAGPMVAAQVGAVERAFEELAQRSAALLRLGDQLSQYLVRANPMGVAHELERLRTTLDDVHDGQARAAYQQTIDARKEQLATLNDIRAAVERIAATVARIVATIEGLSARIVRMAATDAEATQSLSGDMNAELDNMNKEIASFEQMLDTLVPKGVAGA